MSKAKIYTSKITEKILKGIAPEEASRIEKRMLLAARIDDATKAKGWKQKDLAKALKKLPSEISKWLSGTHNFTTDTLFDIDSVLGKDLLCLESKPKDIVVMFPVLTVSSKVAKPAFNFEHTYRKGKNIRTLTRKSQIFKSNNSICQA
jgi:transcriptional regulator with XRE-family HTH domain